MTFAVSSHFVTFFLHLWNNLGSNYLAQSSKFWWNSHFFSRNHFTILTSPHTLLMWNFDETRIFNEIIWRVLRFLYHNPLTKFIFFCNQLAKLIFFIRGYLSKFAIVYHSNFVWPIGNILDIFSGPINKIPYSFPFWCNP